MDFSRRSLRNETITPISTTATSWRLPISDSQLQRRGSSVRRRYRSIPSSNCCNSVPLA